MYQKRCRSGNPSLSWPQWRLWLQWPERLWWLSLYTENVCVAEELLFRVESEMLTVFEECTVAAWRLLTLATSAVMFICLAELRLSTCWAWLLRRLCACSEREPSSCWALLVVLRDLMANCQERCRAYFCVQTWRICTTEPVALSTRAEVGVTLCVNVHNSRKSLYYSEEVSSQQTRLNVRTAKCSYVARRRLKTQGEKKFFDDRVLLLTNTFPIDKPYLRSLFTT